MEHISIVGGSDISRLKKSYSSKKPIFMLIRRDDCPPCEETKPEWMKIPHSVEVKTRDIVIADVEEQALQLLDFMKPRINNIYFPTFVYIKNKQIYPFEEGRTVDAFVHWILSKSTFKKSGVKRKTKSTFKKGRAKRKSKIKTRKRRRTKLGRK